MRPPVSVTGANLGWCMHWIQKAGTKSDSLELILLKTDDIY